MLTLICGLPNAGKTTYSSRYNSVIHLDDFKADVKHLNAQFIQCNIHASQCEGDVCIDGVYGSARLRKMLLKACQHQSPKICIWIDTPIEECVEREMRYRKRPISIIYAHHKIFEPPTLDEGWDEIMRINSNASNEFPTP